jgi:formamidopyrimidine-DNA glycosylase
MKQGDVIARVLIQQCFRLTCIMPELAEVDYFRKRWNPGLQQRIASVELHAGKRIFRGVDTHALGLALTGATLERSEARGKQMLFVAKKSGAKTNAWLGLHLGMTGELRAEKPDYPAAKHDHLILRQAKHALVFEDARLFGRVLFAESEDAPKWWAKLPPDLLSSAFTLAELAKFLKRRAKAPIKAVLLMQERFPGIGNWMADEILWRAAIHPRQLAGDLDAKQTKALYREIRWVCRSALRIIGTNWDDPPKSWLFPHRWQKDGTCPRTGAKLQHATIGGRTTCWSPARQKLK